MKIIKITLILSAIFINQTTHAVQTCKSYISNEWFDDRYLVETIGADNVVTDIKTGLMWKQCSEGLSGVDCTIGTLVSNNWQQALELAEATDFAGYNDWQVPNTKQLNSLVASNCTDPAINATVFPNMPSQKFWSSTPIDGFPDQIWTIIFLNGYGSGNLRDGTGYVRLVRSLN